MDIKIVTSLTLLCLIGAGLSSNPESEIVQDSSESDKNNGENSVPRQKSDSFPGLGVISDPYSSGVKILSPIYTNIGLLWKEVGASSSDDRIRIRDRGTFVDVFSVRRNNRNRSSIQADHGEANPDSGNILSSRSNVPQTSSIQSTNGEDRGYSGTVNVPYASNTARFAAPFRPHWRSVPSGNNYWNNYGFYYGQRGPIGYRPNGNPQNTRVPGPASNVTPPGQSGAGGVLGDPTGERRPNGHRPNVDEQNTRAPNPASNVPQRGQSGGGGVLGDPTGERRPNGHKPNVDEQNTRAPKPVSNVPPPGQSVGGGVPEDPTGESSPNGYRPNVNQQNTIALNPVSNVQPPGRSSGGGVTTPGVGSLKPLGQPSTVRASSVPPTLSGPPPDSNFFSGIVNDFAFKLVHTEKLNQPRKNFVVSPISIFVAASILYMAAEGRTKAQLEQALGLNDYGVHDRNLHRGISDLLSAISPENNELQLANGLFVGANYSVEQPFKEDVQKFYGAELRNLDFSRHEATSRAVDEWVSKMTGNLITSMATPNLVLNGILLLNAIYFKGVWKTQFPLDFTAYERFYTLDGKEKEISLMNLYGEKLPLFRSEEHRHTFIKLPYSGDQVSMIIALPFGLQDSPMPTITDRDLCHIRDAMVERELSTVALPKFRLDYSTTLKAPFRALGVREVFGNSADFGKMRKQRDLIVSEILHKAVVDVNEQGTSASAATSVQFVPLSSYKEQFVANHPFAFYIIHEPSGLVLYYGKIFDLGQAPKAPVRNRSQAVRNPTYNSERMPQSAQSNRERINS